MNLKLKKKCNVVPPDWLRPGRVVYLSSVNSSEVSIEVLREKLQYETNNPGFSEMPLHFAEIAKVLLDVYVLYQ